MVFIAYSEKQELWSNRIEAFLASGQSRRTWCQEHGLPEHQLGYWLRKLQSSKSSHPVSSTSERNRWISVETMIPTNTGVSMRLGKVVLELECGFDPKVLADVVMTLMTVC